MVFINVDLPAPFSPIKATTSAWPTVKLTLLNASTPGKRLVMPLSSSSGGMLIGAIMKRSKRLVLRLRIVEMSEEGEQVCLNKPLAVCPAETCPRGFFAPEILMTGAALAAFTDD